MKQVAKCKVCLSKTKKLFSKKILNKYVVDYYKCTNCGLIQTEKPYWLKEAYSSAIIDSDTGILSRNVVLSKITAVICLILSKKDAKILDYAGGYGVMTRMLRDIGIDCYWTDKYAQNVFAKGFEDTGRAKYDIVSAFEILEHLEDPVFEVGRVIKKYKPKVFLFSTMLHDGNPPKDWWYFAPEGGQHITLYTKRSLEILAAKFGMKLSTNGRNVHVFSRFQIPGFIMKLISISWPVVSIMFPLFFRSKTFSDRTKIVNKK